ncbi:MAG TPA: adenylyltransferase/cytidyltransferase family protein [Candidatus Saccharimonadales bacterium]|nr:adenylyltransferase/cytidyltransferase family protein [Candidatus Saccharimonadales bacterium]
MGKINIAVYIGAFDPIHAGHIEFAKTAVELVGLDKVYFLVEPRPRTEQGVKAFDHRINMASIAIEKEDRLGVIVIRQGSFDFEDVLPALSTRFGPDCLNVLLSEDSIAEVVKWPWLKFSDQSFSLVVGLRKQTAKSVQEQVQLLKDLTGIKIKVKTFKTSVDLPRNFLVKQQLKSGSRPSILPRPVYNYITEKRLYVSDAKA